MCYYSSTHDESCLTGRSLSIIVDAFVRRVDKIGYPPIPRASCSGSLSISSLPSSRVMSFLLEEDVDPSQVRTFLESSSCVLTLQQPVIYIPCDDTGMGA